MKLCAFLVLVGTAAPSVAAAQPTCTVSGRPHRLPVEVSLPSGDPLHIEVIAADVSATILTTERARVEVRGALSLSADVPTRRLPIRAPGAYFDGALHLQGRAALTLLSSSGRGMRFETPLANGRAIFRLPCERLRLGSGEVFERPAPESDGTRWRALASELALRPRPRGAVIVRVLGATTFERLEQRGRWFRIAYSDDDVHLTGWVRATEVQAATGYLGLTARVPGVRPGSAFAGPHMAEALLRPETPVYERPGGVPWAHASRGRFLVRLEPGQEWAQIVHASGIFDPEGRLQDVAWVRRSDIASFLSASSFDLGTW